MFRSRPGFHATPRRALRSDSTAALILRQRSELSHRTDVLVAPFPKQELPVAARNRSAQLATWSVLALLLACSLPAAGASREECERQFKPQTGQPGKDVIWVPTNDGLVGRMLQMAQVTDKDRVYDLGAGDGKIAIAAARDFGAQA